MYSVSLNHMLLTHTLFPANQTLEHEWLHQIKLPDQFLKLGGKFCGNEAKIATQLVTFKLVIMHMYSDSLNHMLLTHTLAPTNQTLDCEWLHQLNQTL